MVTNVWLVYFNQFLNLDFSRKWILIYNTSEAVMSLITVVQRNCSKKHVYIIHFMN